MSDFNVLFNVIQKKGNLILSNREKKNIVDNLINIDKNILKGKSKEDILEALSSIYLKEIVNYRTKARTNYSSTYATKKMEQLDDIESYQQKQIGTNADPEQKNYVDDLQTKTNEINVVSLFGLTDVFKIQSLFNPKASYIKNYLVLDSKYRIRDSQSTSSFTQMQWSYASNANLSTGTVNTVGSIRDVKKIKIYQPRIPYVSNYMLVESRRINMLIEEFKAQSFLTQTGRRFHFTMQPILPSVTPPPEMIELYIDDFADGVYKFDKPITTFDTLTISFGNPFNLIPFNHDSDTVTFTYGSPTIITCSVPHLFNLATGTTYGTITGFTTNNPAADALAISLINSEQEQALTITGASTFTVNVDTTAITPKPGLTCPIYFEERRIVIPMKFTYLSSDK